MGSAAGGEPVNEPVDTATLGRATWTFLHTMAASCPPSTSDVEQRRLRRFMTDFGALYPCEPCAAGFREIMEGMPPVVGGQQEFSQWMCRAHNAVNRDLGKKEFDCSVVDKRWGVCEECKAHAGELAAFKKLMSNPKF